MKKIFLILFLIIFGSAVYAQNVTVTPSEKIKTTTKYFRVGNTYKFKNINTNEIYTGMVTYYCPNGFFGQEAKVEFNNFVDENNNQISGKITIIPSNHKKMQEYGNSTSFLIGGYIRGSEVILKPNVNKFILDEKTPKYKGYVLTLKPANEISTTNDEIEIGDEIEFINQKEVYKNNKLFIAAQTKITGIVDYVDNNGWCADNAVIHINKFVAEDADGNKITINGNLDISGFESLQFKAKRKKQFFNYMSTFVRGKEVDIKTYDKDVIFNVIAE